MKEELPFQLKEQIIMFAAIGLSPFFLIKDILFPPSQKDKEKIRENEIEQMRQRHFKHNRKLDGWDLGRP